MKNLSRPPASVLYALWRKTNPATFADVLTGYGIQFIQQRIHQSVMGRMVYPADGSMPLCKTAPVSLADARLGVWRYLRNDIQSQRDANARRRAFADRHPHFVAIARGTDVPIEDSGLVPERAPGRIGGDGPAQDRDYSPLFT